MIKILSLSNYQADCMVDICNLYLNLEVVSKNFLHYIEIHPMYKAVFHQSNHLQTWHHPFLVLSLIHI